MQNPLSLNDKTFLSSTYASIKPKPNVLPSTPNSPPTVLHSIDLKRNSFLKPHSTSPQRLQEPVPKLKLPNLELTKKQNKLKLNTNHHVIRAMVSLEDQQDALIDKSNFAKSFKRMTAGMKILEGMNTERSMDIVAENTMVFDEKHLREVAPMIKRPEVRWVSSSTNMWMKKRGLELNSTGTVDFMKFLKKFFMAIDENEKGVITPNDIIIPLLSLGLSNDASYIEKAFLNIFDEDNISNIQIDKEKFLNLFKGDKKSEIILNCLDNFCREMLKEEEEKKIAQQAANRRFTSFITQSSIVAHEKPIELKYPTIEEFIRLLRKWWKELANDSASINISRVAEFLAEKGMAGNKHEGRAIAKRSEASTCCVYNSFEKIFLTAILKASFFNAAMLLNNHDFEDFSMQLKLVMVQRRLMMAGTRSKFDPTAKQGRIALHALDSYRKKIGNDEFSSKFLKNRKNDSVG